MQYKNKKRYFIDRTAELIRKLRVQKGVSISKISQEYDIDKSSWSKIERGFYSIEFATAWKMAEALDIDFIEFVKLLKEELGDDFKFMDE